MYVKNYSLQLVLGGPKKCYVFVVTILGNSHLCFRTTAFKEFKTCLGYFY